MKHDQQVAVTPLGDKKQQGFSAEWLCRGDKSLTHRALIFSGLAKGRSKVEFPLWGEDCQSTAEIMASLGAKIDKHVTGEHPFIDIDSPGWDEWQSPSDALDCGNSGTTARLMIGALSAMPGLKSSMIGDESLSSRPMMRVVAPLRDMGAKIDGVDQGNLLPITISGASLKEASHEVSKASAQVKSCLLLAAMNVNGKTRVQLPIGSRDHTERLLSKLGAHIEVEQKQGIETVTLTGPFRPPAGTYKVPGDPSSAAFFSVYAALMDNAELKINQVLKNPTRTGFVNVLRRMGVNIKEHQSFGSDDFMEPVVDLTITGSARLNATVIEDAEIPTLIDEIPILAIAAMFAEGESHFKGIAELKVKESDRLKQTHDLVNVCGGKARIDGDDLFIEGGLESVTSFSFNPLGDHRLAMSAAIAARFSDNPCTIEGGRCVDVSFPGFYEDLEKIFS